MRKQSLLKSKQHPKTPNGFLKLISEQTREQKIKKTREQKIAKSGTTQPQTKSVIWNWKVQKVAKIVI